MRYLFFIGACTLALILGASTSSNKVHFTDVTASAGIKFMHNSGRAGKKFLPETLGSGGAFFQLAANRAEAGSTAGAGKGRPAAPRPRS